MRQPRDEQPFVVEEWHERHRRWAEFVHCLEEIAPDQAPFVLGEYARHLPCCLLVALLTDQVVGFLRFGVQPIGSETGCPPLRLDGEVLTEAKIHAWAVRRESRDRGIGTALQQQAIRRARELNCYQVTSHTDCEFGANHHVKLSLGFCALPEAHGEHRSIQFFLPLRATTEN